MKLSQEVKPYKKVDGIYKKELTRWQKFWLEVGKFLGKGMAGKWEIKLEIKF